MGRVAGGDYPPLAASWLPLSSSSSLEELGLLPPLDMVFAERGADDVPDEGADSSSEPVRLTASEVFLLEGRFLPPLGLDAGLSWIVLTDRSAARLKRDSGGGAGSLPLPFLAMFRSAKASLNHDACAMD